MGLLSVSSEIGALRKVLVHAPGPEWDFVPAVPELAQQYLIEDIFFLLDAQDEHGALRRVLGLFIGDENVLDFRDLLSSVCEHDDNRSQIVAAVAGLEFPGDEISAQLSDPDSVSAKDLATALICGAIVTEGTPKRDYKNLFPPIPNLMFTRDLGIARSGTFILGHPAKPARRREALLMRFLLKTSKLFSGGQVIDVRNLLEDAFWADMSAERTAEPWRRASIEGGDVLVLDDDTLMVGTGERTTRMGLYHLMEILAENPDLPAPKRIIRVGLPQERTSMHLDTVLTMLDRKEFMVFPPIVDEAEFFVYKHPYEEEEIRKEEKIRNATRMSFTEALEEAKIGPVEIVKCGGENFLSQNREQWTDGANMFAIGPGVVLGYDRNTETAEALKERGYRYLRWSNGDDLEKIDNAARRFRAGELEERIAIGLPGAELSRARGGARCMTLPLERDPV